MSSALMQQIENILRSPIIDFVYNEWSTRLSHIVVSVDPFDADEDAVTKCGTLARGADILPSYDWCPECWDAETDRT